MGGSSSKKKGKKKGGSAPPASEAPAPEKPQAAAPAASAPPAAAPAEVKPASPKKEKSSHTEDHKKDDEGSGESGSEEMDEVLYTKDGEQSEKVTKDDFELLNVIGKGSFGKVMQVRKKGEPDKIYAMKVLKKHAIIARKQVAHTKAEKSILQKINHPFIVKLNYAFQTDDKLYMVLDYINGGELFFHLKKEGKFSEERVKLYAAEIVMALAHLHSFGIVYRDLKPENILIDAEGHICITDFGLSKEINQEQGTHTFCGTPEYLAPEVLKGQGHGCAVDWWSLGTLIYEMLTGLPPFYSQNINIMYQKILSGELRFPSYVSPEAQSLLEGFLQRDVDSRLGAKDSNDIKNHPFFKGIDWDKLYKKEVVPTFKPQVAGKEDISQIDPVFTQEEAIDSVVDNNALADTAKQDFEGFTFVAESTMGGA